MRGARAAQIALADGGVYGAVSGPRLETAAEIDRMDRDGATLVGMTGMPEAGLARELGLAYAAVCVVVNHAAGRGESVAAISLDGIARVLETAMDKVRNLIEHIIVRLARAAGSRAPRCCGRSERRPRRGAMIRDVLRMGDPRLLERSREVLARELP